MSTTGQALAQLSNLVALSHEANAAENKKALFSIITNRSYELVNYDRLILFIGGGRFNAELVAISGVPVLDKKVPYIQWMSKLGSSLKECSAMVDLVSDMEALLPLQHSDWQAEWQEWTIGHMLWVPMIHKVGEEEVMVGAMLLDRGQTYSEAEKALLGELGAAYSYALERFLRSRIRWRGFANLGTKVIIGLLTMVAITALVWPVRDSTPAPAIVNPEKPKFATAPFDGVVKSIEAMPNETVQSDQILFTMDTEKLRSELEIVEQRIKVSQAEQDRLLQRSFSDPDSREQLSIAKIKVEEQIAYKNYTNSLLQQASIKAPQAGIVIYDDPNQWIGRPVRTGERVMQLADIDRYLIDIYLPVDDAIKLQVGSEIIFYANINPGQAWKGEVVQTDYEAELTPDSVLSFFVRARITEDNANLRIGLHGTAVVFGDRMMRIQSWLRRPAAYLRRILYL